MIIPAPYKVECRMCEYTFDARTHGIVQLRMTPPEHSGWVDETYLFCTVKCARSWLK